MERASGQYAVQCQFLLPVFPFLFRNQPLQDEYSPYPGCCISQVFLPVGICFQQSEHIKQTGEPYSQQAQSGIRNLDMARRLKLARALRAKYMCSARQVCKSCGLVYDEVKDKV